MFPNLDPKKMQSVMKQMGISQEEINSNRVIIERDGGNIVIDNPQVLKIKMHGQESFQISGDVSEEQEAGISKEDIILIMEKTGRSEEESRMALEKHNGDLTEAIVELSS